MLKITYEDITKMEVDAIVNAANKTLEMGGGVCGAIFNAAGKKMLQEACEKHAPIAVGEAVITPGFNLPARYIIHTAGPRYIDGKHGENILLKDCYRNSLILANLHGCKTVAFPLVSSGIYGYPKDEAFTIAVKAIKDTINNLADIYSDNNCKNNFAGLNLSHCYGFGIRLAKLT